jgi:hypothetical protein
MTHELYTGAYENSSFIFFFASVAVQAESREALLQNAYLKMALTPAPFLPHPQAPSEITRHLQSSKLFDLTGSFESFLEKKTQANQAWRFQEAQIDDDINEFFALEFPSNRNATTNLKRIKDLFPDLEPEQHRTAHMLSLKNPSKDEASRNQLSTRLEFLQKLRAGLISRHNSISSDIPKAPSTLFDGARSAGGEYRRNSSPSGRHN